MLQQDFVVDPTRWSYLLAGSHMVVFPANSICDPATSGYDEGMWDQPCQPLTTPITIHATWSSKYGHAFIDFKPALRFAPSDNPSRWVRLIMKDYYDLDSTYVYPIYWQRPTDGEWVDESQNDPSMGSIKDLPNNFVSRRLKHFSGYWIGAGESCDLSLDGSDSCLPMSGIAGYLLGGG